MTPDPTSEPRWSVLLSLLTCGILPATTARRTNHGPLRNAYLLHSAAALFGVFVIVCIASWGDATAPATFGSVGARFLDNQSWFLEKLSQQPKTTVLSVLGITLLVELGFLGVAYLVMPWGACDEPLGASFRHALRRAWLQTPHIVLIIALVGALGTPLSRWDRSWRASYPIPMPILPTPPTVQPPPKGTSRESQAWRDYKKDVAEDLHRAVQAHRDAVNHWSAGLLCSQPWYLRFNEAIAVDAGFLCGLWLLWALLRSVGAPRIAPPIERPPRCDACGYNLTTIPMESRCPECGDAVTASLGPDARPGAPWQRRREIGRVTAWRRSWNEAVSHPARFARTLRLTSPGNDHRRFLAVHLPIVFLIGAISFAMMFCAVKARNQVPDPAASLLVGGPVFGTMCTLGAIAVTLKSATLASLLCYRQNRRNLMVGAIQVTCYLFVYLVAWEVFGAATGIGAVVMAKADWFRGLTLASRIGPEGFATTLWFIPNLACCIVYWTLVRRAVSGMRYANR